MTGSKQSWIVLLRAIGPSSYKKMSMLQLRESCVEAGLEDVRTYIASGNLLCKTSLSRTNLKSVVEDVLTNYGLSNAVIVRKPAELSEVLACDPHPLAATDRPNHLLTVFFDRKVKKAAASNLISRGYPEHIAVLERELSIDYINGVAKSKLTPAVIDRVIEQPGTARNWNTVNKLVALMQK